MSLESLQNENQNLRKQIIALKEEIETIEQQIQHNETLICKICPHTWTHQRMSSEPCSPTLKVCSKCGLIQ